MAGQVFAVIWSTSFKLTGYGGTRELLIVIGILVIACLLDAYRRLAEDPVKRPDARSD